MVDSGGEQLVFASPFESAKLNIGDYSGMNNIGGQFPLGEVFTEAQDLEAVKKWKGTEGEQQSSG